MWTGRQTSRFNREPGVRLAGSNAKAPAGNRQALSLQKYLKRGIDNINGTCILILPVRPEAAILLPDTDGTGVLIPAVSFAAIGPLDAVLITVLRIGMY